MIIVLSFFIFIILFLIFGLIFSRVKINVKKINLKILKNEILEKDFLVTVGVYLYGKIKIFSVSFKDENIRFMGKKLSLRNMKESAFYKKIIELDIKDLERKIITNNVRDLKLKFEKLNLNLTLGTESTIITSFLIFLLSTGISILIQKSARKYNPKKYNFIITPRYENCNLISTNFESIVSFKANTLIKIFIYLNNILKEKDKDKNNTLIDKKKHYPGYV